MSWSGQSWGPDQPRFAVDLTGDSCADILGFGLDGVWVALNKGDGSFQRPNVVLSGFSAHTGWSVQSHPRLPADLTGDGRADLVGFGDAGVWTALNNGDGTFGPMRLVIADLGVDHGWRVDRHPRVTADLTGDGRADIVGFGDAGVWTALGNGDGTFQAPKLVVDGFCYDQGWRVDQHPRYVVDLTGDGTADIVGYGDAGIWVALGNGDGTFAAASFVLADFGADKGWQGARHPRMTGDLNADRCADLVGFGDAGVYLAANNGSGTFGQANFHLSEFGYDQGWRVERHPRLTADVTGDGRDDLVGFGDAGVWVAVTNADAGADLVVPDFGYDQGWRVESHPRALADLNGDGRADVIGFGDAGVWVALSNGDGTFQPATFVLADFGLHAGPVVEKITLDFHTQDDDLDGDTVLHVFVKNRTSDSTSSGGATSAEANLQAFSDHDGDWFGKNPYLGMAIDANNGDFDDQSTNTVTLQLRSKPIPVEELRLPEVHLHILPNGHDTWKFDYTLTITLDDGTVLPPYSSNVDGVTGIVLDQDNRNFCGIGAELAPREPRPSPVTDDVLTGATIEFKTHNDNKESDTTFDVHIVNRISAAESRDVVVVTGLGAGTEFPDSGDDDDTTDVTYRRFDLPIGSEPVFLRDMVLPVVYLDIAADDDQWIFDYRVTLFFGGQPYSWTVSGVVLNDTQHKHMGVYSGRPFPSVFCPPTPAVQDGRARTKEVSLAFVAQKVEEVFNSRQGPGSADPLVKVKLFSSRALFGDLVPPTCSDIQGITNDPPPPDGQPLSPDFVMTTTYSHSISEVTRIATVLGLGEAVNDLNTDSITVRVDPEDDQTPLTLAVTFETQGPEEVTGSYDLDIVRFDVTLRLTLRYREATRAVDLFGWVDDIEGITATPTGKMVGPAPVYRMQGTFLGRPIDAETIAPDDFRTSLKEEVVKVHFDTGSSLDPGGFIRHYIRDHIYDAVKKDTAGAWDRVTTRDSANATATSFLIGHVIASGGSELVPYPAPSDLSSAKVENGVLSLAFTYPQTHYHHVPPPDWPATTTPGTLRHIDHIVVLMQENRSFDHMLGYLSLPPEKGGMGRHDIDGLKGTESNEYDGRTCRSFPLAPGDTIFSPGPPNGPEMVALQINGGKMSGFVQAQAEECGPATAHRVMGYHTAANVPTYDALARDFAVGHRWFASHPGPTFPNRFYELTGQPNIDAWGAWEYNNSSPLVASISDTIFEKLTDSDVSWRCFEHYYSFIRRLERYTFDSEHVVSYDDETAGFKALASSGNLPAVSFIEPHYVDYPPNSFCDEPPSDIRNSQPFIRDLVEALVAGPKWEQTLLLITYDEHGGFFDHVPPPPAVPVAPGMLPTTGVRVPSFVVSPWVEAGSVFGSDSLHFDHTSILKTIARRFLHHDYPYLGARYAAAHDLSEVVGHRMRHEQFRPFIPYTLVYAASGTCLEVAGGSTDAGAEVAQSAPDGTEAQHFRFEDAGNGFVRIRTLAGLYLTADEVTHGHHSGVAIQVRQEPKIGHGSGGTNGADRQRWKLAPSPDAAHHPDEHTVTCGAYPHRVLKTVHEHGPGVVALAQPSSHSPTTLPHVWIVTSPRLP